MVSVDVKHHVYLLTDSSVVFSCPISLRRRVQHGRIRTLPVVMCSQSRQPSLSKLSFEIYSKILAALQNKILNFVFIFNVTSYISWTKLLFRELVPLRLSQKKEKRNERQRQTDR